MEEVQVESEVNSNKALKNLGLGKVGGITLIKGKLVESQKAKERIKQFQLAIQL